MSDSPALAPAPAPASVPEGYVRLLAADGAAFLVARDAACASKVIRRMLESDFREAATREIRFPDADAEVLEKVCQHMYYVKRQRALRPAGAARGALEAFDVPRHLTVKLLLFASFLDIEPPPARRPADAAGRRRMKHLLAVLVVCCLATLLLVYVIRVCYRHWWRWPSPELADPHFNAFNVPLYFNEAPTSPAPPPPAPARSRASSFGLVRVPRAQVPPGVQPCVICCDDLCCNRRPVVAIAACNHRFHAACIERWLRAAACPTCPECRTAVQHKRPAAAPFHRELTTITVD